MNLAIREEYWTKHIKCDMLYECIIVNMDVFYASSNNAKALRQVSDVKGWPLVSLYLCTEEGRLR